MSLNNPSYFCKRYQKTLNPLRARRMVREFMSEDGEVHPCFKLKGGRWAKCRKLQVN